MGGFRERRRVDMGMRTGGRGFGGRIGGFLPHVRVCSRVVEGGEFFLFFRPIDGVKKIVYHIRVPLKKGVAL